MTATAFSSISNMSNNNNSKTSNKNEKMTRIVTPPEAQLPPSTSALQVKYRCPFSFKIHTSIIRAKLELPFLKHYTEIV